MPKADDKTVAMGDQGSAADGLAAVPAVAAAPSTGAIRLKVEPPHSSMTYGGVVIGTEYTEVPLSHLGPLTQAAADAGVTLTQEE